MKKKGLSLLLAAAVTLSLTACGGGAAQKENDHVVSKGIFVLDPEQDHNWITSERISSQQTIVLHVYDLIPDEKKNAELNTRRSDYQLQLNGTNTYEDIGLNSESAALNSFIYSSGYKIPSLMKEILAGGEPIRVISAFIVNKNDISDDMTAQFAIQDGGMYRCKQTFQKEDFTMIQHFDEIFQIEDDPTEYQAASTWHTRARRVWALLSHWNWDNDAYIIGAMAGITAMQMGDFHCYPSDSGELLAKLPGEELPVYELTGGEDIPQYYRQAGEKLYPDIAEEIGKLSEDLEIMRALVIPERTDSGYTTEVANQINAAVNDAYTVSQKIFDYFESNCKSE